MWYCDILLAPTIFLLLKHVANLDSELFKSSNTTDNMEVNRSCLKLGASRKVSLLFHPETNDCYAKESKGPCGEKMKLYSVDGKIGECDCDSSSRMLIYFKEENQCFPIFQRGPCKSGKWTDVTQEGMPTCVQNPCYRNSVNNEEKDLVMFNGTCVEVGETSVCGQGFKVGFESGKRLPRCIPKFGMFGIQVPQTSCKPGTYRAINSKCQPEFEFDFDDN